MNCSLTRENGSFRIIDGANGIKVNVSDSVKNISEFVGKEWDKENASIELAVEVTEPQGTRKSFLR